MTTVRSIHNGTLHSSAPHLNQSYGFSRHLYGRFSFCAATFLLNTYSHLLQNIGGWISGQSFDTSKWKAASKSSAKLEHSYALVWRSSTVDIAACFLTDFEPLLSLQPQTRHRSSNLQLHAVFITNSMWLVSLYGLYRARGSLWYS